MDILEYVKEQATKWCPGGVCLIEISKYTVARHLKMPGKYCIVQGQEKAIPLPSALSFI
jgi:hypothetical protein